jgi:hypothetical protein
MWRVLLHVGILYQNFPMKISGIREKQDSADHSAAPVKPWTLFFHHKIAPRFLRE